jgi:hypothetical protein
MLRRRRSASWIATAVIAELDAKENSLIDLKLADSIGDDALKRQLSRIQEQRRSCLEVLANEQKRIDGAYLETAQRVLELAKNAKRL